MDLRFKPNSNGYGCKIVIYDDLFFHQPFDMPYMSDLQIRLVNLLDVKCDGHGSITRDYISHDSLKQFIRDFEAITGKEIVMKNKESFL